MTGSHGDGLQVCWCSVAASGRALTAVSGGSLPAFVVSKKKVRYRFFFTVQLAFWEVDFPWESAAALMCREGGARVTTDILVREMDVARPNPYMRRLEVVASEFAFRRVASVWSSKQRWCRTQRADGRTERSGAVGGRWSEEIRFLPRLAKSRQAPPILCRKVEQAWRMRWKSILSCAAAKVFTSSLLELRGGFGADGFTRADPRGGEHLPFCRFGVSYDHNFVLMSGFTGFQFASDDGGLKPSTPATTVDERKTNAHFKITGRMGC